MKVAVVCLALALWLAAGWAVHAQTESFDLVTFATPVGNRSATADVVGYTDATPTTFCQYAVYRSAPGSGDPARDFAGEWAMLVAGPYKVTGPLNSQTVDWPGGWKMTMGAAKVHTEGARNFVALLSVYSGYGVKVSILVNYNDDLYRPKVDHFLASLQLRPPAPAAGGAVAPTAGPAGAPALTGREWHHSIANYSQWGTNPSGVEIAKIGNQGYKRWTYVFNPNGTYSFVSEFWSMSRYQEYWFVEENGTFTVSGDALSLSPRQARRILRNKAGQQQGEAVPAELEPTAYRYQFHFFEGLGEWNLVLTPVNGRETKRDGTFTSNSLFPGSYLYGKPPVKN